MRRLVLSLALLAVSGAYVAQSALNDERGLEGLLDRLLFRDNGAEAGPLNLDGASGRDELLTSISAASEPAPPRLLPQ